MQTFLPYADFELSAQALDRQRLGKQRLEARSILEINLGVAKGNGWRHHPAVLMWKGFETMLAIYGVVISNEWSCRGYEDQQLSVFTHILGHLKRCCDLHTPPWLGNRAFHSAHRAALLFKKPEWYGQFGWIEEPGIHYVWPRRR